MDYLSGWCKSERRLEGSTVIVTGSNTGMGREVALDLYKRGARVIMACRNVLSANETKEDIEKSKEKGKKSTGELVVEQLDLCSLTSVRQFVQRVTSRERALHVLVCNAGVMMCPESRTQDGFEMHIGVNHLGHALLTLLLLPLLIKSAPSRIVIVSSRVHEFYRMNLKDIELKESRYTRFRAYVNSKTANLLFANALDYKLKEHNIHGVSTYSLHPGIVKTDVGRHFSQTAWRIIDYGFQNPWLQWCWKTPRCGAQTIIYCAVDEKCENESGCYYSDCAKTSPSRQCQSKSEAGKLWNITIDILNLQDFNPFTED